MKNVLSERYVHISLFFNEAPSINFGAQTNEFGFESLEDHLHIPAPRLNFRYTDSSIWYAGVPLSFTASATNIKSIPFQNATIQVTIAMGKTTIHTFNSGFGKQVDPGKWLCLPITTTINTPGQIHVKAKILFKYENSKLEHKVTKDMQIYPALNCCYSFKQKPVNLLTLDIENLLPCSMHTISISAANISQVPFPKTLAPGEIGKGCAANFVTAPSNINISWSIPYSFTCTQTIRIAEAALGSKSPILIAINNKPEIVPAYKPFIVDMTITNITKGPISGNIFFTQRSSSCFPFGKNEMIINELDPNQACTFSQEFIGLSLSKQHYPSANFVTKDQRNFRIDFSEGVIIVSP